MPGGDWLDVWLVSHAVLHCDCAAGGSAPAPIKKPKGPLPSAQALGVMLAMQDWPGPGLRQQEPKSALLLPVQVTIREADGRCTMETVTLSKSTATTTTPNMVTALLITR